MSPAIQVNRFLEKDTHEVAMKKQDTSKIAAIHCPNCGAAATMDSAVCAYCDSTLYARFCTNCFGAVGSKMKHCPHCGAKVTEAKRAPQKDLKCPICKSTLETHDSDDHPIYACPKCGGTWLDHDSFELICDRVEKKGAEPGGYQLPGSKVSIKRPSRRAYIPCPECGTIMTPKNFARCSGVVIDCCRKHGNWFDWQKLHQIMEFIQKGGMRKSLKLEIERAREDVRMGRNIQLGSNMQRYISDSGIKAPAEKPGFFR
jgi:Zn-finger nucleic acid-binding protein